MPNKIKKLDSFKLLGFFIFLFISLGVVKAFAAPTFPNLTGYVIDEANLINPQTEIELSNKLAQIEKESSDQIIVVTLNSLQDYPIEEYGYQLGRHWGIGQKKINNGILLIIAPNERKVRIEVGYGLEGIMPDAIASNIIKQTILPEFKSNNYELGIINGLNEIDKTLKLDPNERAARAKYIQSQPSQSQKSGNNNAGNIFVIFFIVWLFVIMSKGRGAKYNRHSGIDSSDVLNSIILYDMYNKHNSSNHNNDGGGFGGFGGFGGGGGGGFGGGGASGDW